MLLLARRQRPPAWVFPLGPALDIDFFHNRAWNGSSIVPPEALVAEARTGTAWEDDPPSQHWQTYGPNQLRFSPYGALAEETRTNTCLWNRDLTNAVWVKTTMTTAQNQAGVDGITGSATLLTASGANATCLQTITLASTAVLGSAFIQRVTGSGSIQMTIDGGTTWTTVTPGTLGNVWGSSRVTVPVQTLANPVVGFRIVTSGDAILVDMVGAETGNVTQTYRTSPISNTTVASTRGTSLLTIKQCPQFGAGFTLYASIKANAPLGYASDQFALAVSNGTNANRFALRRTATTSVPNWVINTTGSATNAGATTPANTSSRLIASYTPGAQNGCAGTTATLAAATPGVDATALTGINTIEIGSEGLGTGALPWDGYIFRIAIWPRLALSLSAMMDIGRLQTGF